MLSCECSKYANPISKKYSLQAISFFFGYLLVAVSCVYDPPPKTRTVDIKNMSSDSLILFWIKSSEFPASDSILIHNSLFRKDGKDQKIPIEILPPHSSGTTDIGAGKNWLDHIDCKCVTFYFIKFSSFKQYTWGQLQADSTQHIKTITWYKDDLLEKGKSLVINK